MSNSLYAALEMALIYYKGPHYCGLHPSVWGTDRDQNGIRKKNQQMNGSLHILTTKIMSNLPPSTTK